ncbi:efflux RND transporter periplasmic adaptor subunit [Trinickia sp.]|uniref:efflux RND transporter periplasmic adaptor subunit n=1 Tax=Trinickia sp. TaxID=2571163 RepID=UPI003F81F73E
MKTRFILISAASLAIAAAGGWYAARTVTQPSVSASSTAAQPASPATPAQPVQTVGGETVVVVAPDAQRASGMTVAPLAVATVQPRRDAYVTVIDPQPLFDLRVRLAGARADIAALSAQARNSSAQYQRSLGLYRDDRNVSLKALQDARAAMEADDAKVQAAQATLNGLTATARAQFGEALASAALAPESALLARLQAGRGAILRVVMPTTQGAVIPDHIAVRSSDQESIDADKLSPSPAADPAVPGVPWFYTTLRALPIGTRTSATVPTSPRRSAALLVPANAVVWYGGQTWAYVRVAPDRFARRAVVSTEESDAGFAVTSGFREGDSVVTHGAQLLLSEELKPQGIATACKDPPECDD